MENNKLKDSKGAKEEYNRAMDFLISKFPYWEKGELLRWMGRNPIEYSLFHELKDFYHHYHRFKSPYKRMIKFRENNLSLVDTSFVKSVIYLDEDASKIKTLLEADYTDVSNVFFTNSFHILDAVCDKKIDGRLVSCYVDPIFWEIF